MMISDYYSFISCPYCGHPKKMMTMLSGNTIGASQWTDGVVVFPMLLKHPDLLKCKACCSFFWYSEKIDLDIVEYSEIGRKISKIADTLKRLTVEEYYEAINNKQFCKNVEIEKELRIFAWQRWNDMLRGNGNMTVFSLPDRVLHWKDNLQCLLKILDENIDKECIIKGEIYRNLGRFKKAKKMLLKANNTEYSEFITKLIQFCDMNVTEVKKIK